MAQTTKYAIDGTANTASLEIYVDGALQTTYVYNGAGGFTLSERPNDVSLSSIDLARNVAAIREWHALVKKSCSNLVYGFNEHDVDFKDEANKTVFKLRFGEVLAIHAIYHKSTTLTEFKARPELFLTPEQFRRFEFVLMIIGRQPMNITGWL